MHIHVVIHYLEFYSLSSDFIYSKQQYNLVSSAYIKKLNTSLALEKSYIETKNKRGPSIDPCGTPLQMAFIFDL